MDSRSCISILLVLAAVVLCSRCSLNREYSYEKIVAAHRKTVAALDTLQPPGQTPDLSALAHPISMTDAIRIALHNNPEVELAVARIRQSETLIDEANAAFWPSLGVYTEYLTGDAPSAYFFKKLDQRMLPPQFDFNDPGSFQNYESGVIARYNLFRGGRDLLQRKMAETGHRISQLERSTVANALVASVIQAYYSTLAAKDFIEIAAASVETVSTELKMVQVRYDGGGALKSDLLSLQVRLAQVKQELIQAQNHYQLSVASLASLLGGDADTPLQLSGQEWQPPQTPSDYQSGVERALGMRPELLKIRQQLIASQMAVDQVKGEYAPQLDALGKTYFDDEHLAYDANRMNWTVGVILNWDLFTGFNTRAKLNNARAVLDEMLAADRQATQEIQLDVKTAYLKQSQAEASVAVSEASVAQAAEALRLVKKEYEGGSATIVRYLDAELARNRARILNTAARYDVKKAHADISRALGYFGELGERSEFQLESRSMHSSPF